MKNLHCQLSPSENPLGPLPLPLKKTNLQPFRFQNNFQTEKGNEIWLLTMSDLLMLLMIFFVVLFGMALQREKQTQQPLHASIAVPVKSVGNQTGNDETPVQDGLQKDMSASLERDLIAILGRERGHHGVMVERIADLVILTFPERIVFDPGQAQLKPSAQATLGKVAAFIEERPFAIVEVQGHTDDRPINNARYPSNWELSVERATQVAKALISLGVNPTQLSVKGFGEYRCLVPNDRDQNRLKNRRVEIQLSIPPSLSTTSPQGAH